MKLFVAALFVVILIASSSSVSAFSEPAARGSFCDHDKIKKDYLDNKYTVAHSRDTGNNPLNIAYSMLTSTACTATQLATDSAKCGKCGIAGEKMPTFVADRSSAETVSAELAVCNTSDLLTTKKEDYITYLLDQATAELNGVLGTPNYLGGLRPSPAVNTLCGRYPGVRMPDSHAAPLPGGGQHYVLYVTAGPDSPLLAAQRNRSSVSGAAHPPPLARGATCGYTTGEERPLTGHLHFVPAAITAADPAASYSDTKKRKDVMFVVHQLFHMLGYSEPFFRQGVWSGTGVAYLGSRRTYLKGVYTSGYKAWTNGENRRLMATVNVRNKARAFFGCSTLAGAESYEHQQDSHWAKRIFVDDVMAEPLPWDTGVPVISDVTLAFFHDTTFFSPRYGTKAQSMHGWSRGCDFAQKDCRNRRSFGANKNVDWAEYCWDRRDAQCSADMRAGGPCNLVDYSQQVPSSSLQYFTTSDDPINDMTKTGGTVVEDFCGLPVQDGGIGDDLVDPSSVAGGSSSASTDSAVALDKESTVNDAAAFYSQCDDLSNWRSVEATTVRGNVYGDSTTDSRCYIGTVNRMGATPRSPYREARCTMMRCAKDSIGRTVVFLELFNGSVTVQCPVDGGAVEVGLFNEEYAGEIVCPPATLCTDRGGKLLRKLTTTVTPTAAIDEGTGLTTTAVCSGRLVCANKARSQFGGDARCGDLSRAVSNCFAARCNSEKETFFRELGLAKNCSAPEFKMLATRTCADGIAGAADLCALLQTTGAGAVSATIVLAMVVLQLVLGFFM